MPISCKYTKLNVPACAAAEWIIAFLCDHCMEDGTMEVCDYHYHVVYMDSEVRLACGNCQGTLSWMSERIDHAAEAEVINE